MKRQEHNRSLERDVAWEKNQDPTSMTVPRENTDICNRPEITDKQFISITV